MCNLIRNSCRVSQRNFTGGNAAVNSKPFAVSEKKPVLDRFPIWEPSSILCSPSSGSQKHRVLGETGSFLSRSFSGRGFRKYSRAMNPVREHLPQFRRGMRNPTWKRHRPIPLPFVEREFACPESSSTRLRNSANGTPKRGSKVMSGGESYESNSLMGRASNFSTHQRIKLAIRSLRHRKRDAVFP